MPWYAWYLIGMIVFGSLLTVNSVGKPRDTITPGFAVFSVCLAVFHVYIVYTLATDGM
jgi:uncharacterized membrane protein YadS